MKDYQASTTSGDFEETSEEQNIEVAMKTFSANTLSGVMIVDHWTHADGTVYALAKLDLVSFSQNVEKMGELNGRVREFVRKNAEKAHDALAAEKAKREQ